MFRIEFEQLTLTLGQHKFTYAIDGGADVADFDDAWTPAVVSIYLRPDGNLGMVQLPQHSELWPTLAAAIMETCASDIADKFYATIPPSSYAAEHWLRQHEVI